MAKNTAPQAPGAANSVFELDDTELESLKSTRGRKEEPSKYLEVVKAAVANGDPDRAYGINLSATLKAAQVGAQLRKAVKQLDLDSKCITVFDRSEDKYWNAAHPFGFVAFKVDVKPADDASETSEDSE